MGIFVSRYGVITSKEHTDVRSILSQLYGECITTWDFINVLSKNSCNVDREAFALKLDVIGLSWSYFKDAESQRRDERNKRQYDSLREMCRSSSDDHKRCLEQQGIVETIDYLAEDKFEYLQENSIVAFVLILLQHSKRIDSGDAATLVEIFSEEEQERDSSTSCVNT